MSIVSNTSPLRYLVEIDAVHVLPLIFGNRIVIPPAVLSELTQPNFPESVRQWANNLPSWIEVRPLANPSSFTPRLHPGEADAIELAVKLGVSRILLDERDGVQIAENFAKQNNLPLRARGTLTVLAVAAELKLIDLNATLLKLTQTRFRCTPNLLDRLLRPDPALRALLQDEIVQAERIRGLQP